MLDLNRTICALATPPGEGGIAVVRLSGPAAYPVAERVFQPANPAKKVAEAKGYTALFGHYLLDGQRMDEEWPCFTAPPTATPARTWWSFPATEGGPWRMGWCRPA